MIERDLDVTKRDLFELLSAYLDGEVTADERQLVQQLLVNDPAAKRLYGRLLTLRHGFQTLPAQPCDGEATLAQVFCVLNRRLRLACMAGAGVCIMGTLGLLSGTFGPRHSLIQWASMPAAVPEDGYSTLQVSLDEPVFALPLPTQNLLETEEGLPADSEL